MHTQSSDGGGHERQDDAGQRSPCRLSVVKSATSPDEYVQVSILCLSSSVSRTKERVRLKRDMYQPN